MVRSSGWAIIRFTVLRVLLFGGIWLLLQLTTPLRGLIAAVVALLVSGVISTVVLNRQRAAMGVSLAGFFGRINARIDASSRAEDEADDLERSGNGEQEAQAESVDKNE